MHIKKLKWLSLIAVLTLSFALPIVVGDTALSALLVNTLLICGAASAWNIFSGYTGYLSLGHAVYYGLGAYTLAIVCNAWNIPGGFLPFVILPLAGLVGTLFAIPLGWIALKTRQHTFMILTLAIFYIFHALASNLSGISGGSEGMFLPFPTWDATFYNVPFYFAALAIFLLVLLVAWLVYRSKFGLGLRAVSDDEGRALGLGVKTQSYKLLAYALSAFFVAMIGGLAAYYVGSVAPDQSLSPTFDLAIVLIVFLGGKGRIVGPLVGGILVIPLQQFLNQQFGATPLESVLYGGILLSVILLLPEGIVPSLDKHWKSWMSIHHKSIINVAQQSQIHAAPENASVINEAQLPQMDAALEMSPGIISPIAAQSMTVQSVPVEPPSHQTVWSRPLYPPARPVSPLPYTTGSLPRVRAQRLVPASSRNPTMKVQAETADSAVVSWRCPNCRKPFLLRGDNCFCPRCGIIRSVSGN